MKRFLALLVLLTLAACARSPTPGSDAQANLRPLTFGGSGDDVAYGLARHSSGVYVVGTTTGNLYGASKGATDTFIAKYGTNGTFLWGKQFGTSSFDSGRGIASDGNSNAYVVGTTRGSFSGSSGANDIYVRKYAPGGSAIWTRQFGSSSEDLGLGVAVSGDSVYVVGAMAVTYPDYDAVIRRYTTSGAVLWTRQFGTSGSESAADVAVDGSGNAYVVGSTTGSLGGPNGGGSDMFIRAYSPSGGVLWTRQLHYGDYDSGPSVALTGSYVYLVSHSDLHTTSTTNAVHVYKYTTSGSLVWSRTRRDSRSFNDATDVSADALGNVYLTGTTRPLDSSYSDGYVRKLNASGTTLWTQRISHSRYDRGNAVLIRASNEVYAVGDTEVSAQNDDAYLRRFTSSGSTVWIR
jgi:hypothetical protein